MPERIIDAVTMRSLVHIAEKIHGLLGDTFKIGVIDADTEDATPVVAITDLDGDGSWIGVTITGTPDVVWQDGRKAT